MCPNLPDVRIYPTLPYMYAYVNPFKPIVFSHPFQLDQSISILRVVGWYMYFSSLLKFYKKFLFANSGEPDQTPHFGASDLVLQCLQMSHKKDAMLIWVNNKTKRMQTHFGGRDAV